MVLLVRIEVWTGRSESWSLTFGDLVNVGGTFAGRQVLEVEHNRDAGTALAIGNSGRANALSLRISQFHDQRLVLCAHDVRPNERHNNSNNSTFGHVVPLQGNPLTNFALGWYAGRQMHGANEAV
jgi:hypothetical protein